MLRPYLTVIHLLLNFHSMEDMVRWRGVCCQATERFDSLADLLYFSRSGKKSDGCFYTTSNLGVDSNFEQTIAGGLDCTHDREKHPECCYRCEWREDRTEVESLPYLLRRMRVVVVVAFGVIRFTWVEDEGTCCVGWCRDMSFGGNVTFSTLRVQTGMEGACPSIPVCTFKVTSQSTSVP